MNTSAIPLSLTSLSQRAAAARPTPWLETLNAEQREAVESVDGAVLVLAGAGTGKTRVLTARIAHILALGLARPHEILSVTFTNKAAREMRHRIEQLIGMGVEGMPWLGTFHSIGTKLLRRHAELVGLQSNFTILDTDDQLRLLKQLIAAENIDEKRFPPRALAAVIDGWKNRGLTPDKVPSQDAHSYGNGLGITLYKAYQQRLKDLNAVDFGDLLVLPILLLQNNPEILEEYRRRFKYILVDEYQDTNVAQYLWLRLLAGTNGHVCCVGDDDQSIYGWRGAEVENILRFEKDFPGAKVIKLERNYRSTAHILDAAAHLITHNDGRLGKTLHTDSGEKGEKLQLTSVWDSEEEARSVGEEIEQLQRKGNPLSSMAILVRASFQMREFEDRFVTLGVNYRVIGGPRFYERAEIRDAMAYFRLTLQPRDDLAFERIINQPKRGLGETTVKQLHVMARAAGCSLFQLAEQVVETNEMKPKQRAALKEFVQNFNRWREQVPLLPHVELAQIILDESGYTDMWKQERTPEAQGRLENLKELMRAMEPYGSLPEFQEHVALVMDAESKDNQDAVTIMTLHGAKGLEFDTVFLPGWEESLFPHQRSLDEKGKAGLEEERRLAYVGITRARKRAYISFASNRRIHGSWNSTIPSRFIDELPEAAVQVNEGPFAGRQPQFQPSGFQGGSSRFAQPSGFQEQRSRFDDEPKFERFSARESQPTYNRYAASQQKYDRYKTIEGQVLSRSESSTVKAASYAVGARVFHVKFGYGIVTSAEGDKLSVNFDKAGEKKVMAGFVEQAS